MAGPGELIRGAAAGLGVPETTLANVDRMGQG